ncbi:MAG TPA: hypothetical protein VJB12_02225 [Candidatus Nanoarchaeia archaeon]|nr:hypothetical protein [Candidatus Nanoarchaeia archaeon]
MGDSVKKGEKLFTVYSESREKLAYALDLHRQHPAYILS